MNINCIKYFNSIPIVLFLSNKGWGRGGISGDNAHIQGSAHMFIGQLFERDPMEKDLGPEYV